MRTLFGEETSGSETSWMTGRRRDVVIRMALTEILREDVDWLNVARGRNKWRGFVNAVMKFYVIHTVFLKINTPSGISTSLSTIL